MDEFAGKVAVVTGAGQGIGRELVRRFGAEGMKVVVADIVPALIDETVAGLQADGVEALGVVTDVTSLESVEALRDASYEAFGAVHVLCNNAGIGVGADGQMWDHHVNDWRWAFDVNVFGVINGIHAFVPTMLERGEEGHVVNTTSGNGGFTPMASGAIYPTTKAAIATLTECLWAQLRSAGAKIGASLLYPSTQSPGMLNTGIWRPGANRPDRFDRPGAAPKEGHDALTPLKARFEEAGIPLVFAPLEEVAEMCLQGIRNETFWISATSDEQAGKIRARAQSQIDQTPPDYLLTINPIAPQLADGDEDS